MSGRRELCLLACDGGGVRGISSLEIIEEIMERLRVKLELKEKLLPGDYFDLIGGTSTGGLIAIMLGRLRMSAAEAIKVFEQFGHKIFGNGRKVVYSAHYNGDDLKDAVIDLLNRMEMGSEVMMGDPEMTEDSKGRCFVLTSPQEDVTNVVHIRSYESSAPNGLSARIWEAARATTAATTFFDPINIKGKYYIDSGPANFNNPSEEVFTEGKQLFDGNNDIALLVSVGTGSLDEINIKKPQGLQTLIPVDVVKSLVKVATSCGKVHQSMERQLEPTNTVYQRFNLDTGGKPPALDEWNQMEALRGLTRDWLRKAEVSSRIDEVVDILAAIHRRNIPRSKPEPRLAGLLSSIDSILHGKGKGKRQASVVSRLSSVTEGVAAAGPPSTDELAVSLKPGREELATSDRGSFLSNNSLPALASKHELARIPVNGSPRFRLHRDADKQLNGFFEATKTIVEHKEASIKIFVLAGRAGIGKTQSVWHYYASHKESYDLFIWIHAQSQATIAESLEKAARLLMFEKEIPSDIDAKTFDVPLWLSSHHHGKSWLMIVDGADENLEEVIYQLVPNRDAKDIRGHVVVTTRNWRAELVASDLSCGYFEVDEMDEDDAVDLLLASARIDRPRGRENTKNNKKITLRAREIVEALDYWPLAVEQAGWLIHHGRVGLHNFVDTLKTDFLGLFHTDDFTATSRYGKGVLAVLQESLGTLHLPIIESQSLPPARLHIGVALEEQTHEERYKLAISLLGIFACCHHDDVPSWIFARAAKIVSQRPGVSVPAIILPFLQSSTSQEWNRVHFNVAIGDLSRAGFVARLQFGKRQTQVPRYDMVPLVHAWAWMRMDETMQNEILEATCFLFETCIDTVEDIASHRLRTRIFFHVCRLYNLRRQHQVRTLADCEANWKFAQVFREQCCMDLQLHAAKIAFKQQEKLMNTQQAIWNVATRRYDYAVALRNNNQLVEAEMQIRMLLHSHEGGGNFTRDVIWRANQELSWIFTLQGDVKSAERILRAVLEEQSNDPSASEYGPKQPNSRDQTVFLYVHERLAEIDFEWCRVSEAVSRMQQVATRNEQVFGEKNLYTLRAKQKLAIMLLKVSYEEAHKLIAAVYMTLKLNYGGKRHHPDTMRCMVKFGRILAAEGTKRNFEQAKKRLSQAFALMEPRFGAEHYEVLMVRHHSLEARFAELVASNAIPSQTDVTEVQDLLIEQLAVNTPQHAVNTAPHPNSILTAHLYAKYFHRAGLFELAAKAAEHGHSMAVKVYDAMHPSSQELWRLAKLCRALVKLCRDSINTT